MFEKMTLILKYLLCPLCIFLQARHTHEYVPCFSPHFRNPVRRTLETTNVLLKISGEMTTPPLPLARKLTLYLFISYILTILSVFHLTFHLPFHQTPVKSDAGEYKCSVKNKWGTDYTTFQLG